MSIYKAEAPFIVSTPTGRGAWYLERRSTISLINSHVASFRHKSAAQPQPQDIADLAIPQQDHDRDAFSESTDHWTHPAIVSNDIGFHFSDSDVVTTDAGSTAGRSSDIEHAMRWHSPCDPLQSRVVDAVSDVQRKSRDHVTRITPRRRTLPARSAQNMRPAALEAGQRNHSSWGSRRTVTRYYTDSERLNHSDGAVVSRDVGGSLIPFVAFPVKVSIREQQLLHFFLTHGRQLLFGTTASPSYCPAIQIVQNGVLQRLPVYAETHIAMAEHMLCKLRNVELSKNFFRRRASAYRSVADLIRKPDISFDEQMMGLSCIILAEQCIGRYDLQVLHLRAMHDVVERCGGIRSCFQSLSSFVSPSFYSCHFIFAKFSGSYDPATVHTFFSGLSRVRAWTLRLQMLSDTSPADASARGGRRTANKRALGEVRGYLLRATDRHLRDPAAPYHLAAGVFYLLFTICINLSDFKFDTNSTLELLLSLQSCMKESVQKQPRGVEGDPHTDTRQLDGLHPLVPICPLTHFIRELKRHDGMRLTDCYIRDTEVSVAEVTISAMKVFPLLSISTRLRIARGLFRSCMITSELTLGESFSIEELEDLNLELQRVSK